MRHEDFEILTCTYKNGIYAGRWRSTPYSVAVRYRGSEVSMSALDPAADPRAAARLMLSELVAKHANTGGNWSAATPMAIYPR